MEYQNMEEILYGVLCAAGAFVSGIVLIAFGVSKKKNLLIIASLICFLLAVASGSITGYRFVSKSYQKARYTYRQGKQVYSAIGNPFKLRNGPEIYTALLGPQISQCLEVVKYQDQLIPKIDYAIILHVKTCPEEVQRIVSLRPFSAKILTGHWLAGEDHRHTDWFLPSTLGDSVIVYENYDENANGQSIYTNREKTEAYIVDVLD
jgi:hypothetical protein